MCVRCGGGGGGCRVSMLMAMGRWSELSCVRGVQVESRARWLLTMVRSGDEGLPCVGRRVGWSSLRRTIWLESMASTIVNPLAAARSSCVAENHALLWALKSPTMTMLWSCCSRRLVRSGA